MVLRQQHGCIICSIRRGVPDSFLFCHIILSLDFVPMVVIIIVCIVFVLIKAGSLNQNGL